MLRSIYIPLVERERLAHECLDLRQTIESVTEITKMFTERAFFCLDFATSEQAQMTQYLSTIKMDIRQFVSTQSYGSLTGLQDAIRR